MEKEQIISTLTEKLGTTQLSSRTLATYVENNLLGEGEEYSDTYFNKHVGILKSLQGQYSADVANQVNSFKAEWEKNHPVQAPTTPAQQTEPTKPTDDVNKALIERIESLEKALSEQKANATQAEVKSAVMAKSDELKVTNKYLWDKVVRETPFAEGTTSAKLLEVVKNTYEVELKAIIGNGAAPYGVSGTPNPQESLKSLDDYFNSKKSQGKF